MARETKAFMPDPRTTASTADAPSVQPFVLLTLAIIAGSGAANLYYSQPLLGVLRGIFGPLAPTFVATATLLGYGLGILLLVPLGDTWPRRTLIVTQQLALAAALGVVAIAPNLTILTPASVVVGIFSTMAQQAIPLVREEPVLRWATLTQGCNFAAFNVFWATLALEWPWTATTPSA